MVDPRGTADEGRRTNALQNNLIECDLRMKSPELFRALSPDFTSHAQGR